MAQTIVNNEARRDADGRIRVYKLPSNDGGGNYEVAGINQRYHPTEAAALRDMVNNGKQAEAETRARDYIANYTDSTASMVTNPGAEFYLRDSAWNRGPGGGRGVFYV